MLTAKDRVRLLPPLVISDEELLLGVEKLKKVIAMKDWWLRVTKLKQTPFGWGRAAFWRWALVGFLKKTSLSNVANNKRTVRYQFADNLVHFYYRYVQKNRSRLSVWSAEDVWERLIEDDFEHDYVQKCFEEIRKMQEFRENRRLTE